MPTPSSIPQAVIAVPVRNEAERIAACLRATSSLTLPSRPFTTLTVTIHARYASAIGVASALYEQVLLRRPLQPLKPLTSGNC